MRNDTHRRLKIEGQPLRKQKPAVRVLNWRETFVGFDLRTAQIEAARCIQCPDAPCQQACPVGNDIPGAFRLLEQGDVIGAANIFRETSNLPEMCGRLCPQERLCEGDCVVAFAIRPDDIGAQPAVAIGKLESYVTDYQRRELGGWPMPEVAPPSGCRVAVVGAGPAGLAAAEQLAVQGHSITLFDAWSEPGGVLLYGIPNFKMEKHILDQYVAHLGQLGIEFTGNTFIGRDVTIDELFERGYDAVFLGHGASLGNRLEIPGVDLPGVIMATEFLVRGNLAPEQLPSWMRDPLPEAGRVVVIGGGDTSMDCVRTAIRLGAREVTCAYRRTEAEQLGREEERVHAREEGVRFEYLAAPLRIEASPSSEGRVARARFARMALGDPDSSGRRRPEPTGEEFEVEADVVVIAIGYGGDEAVVQMIEGHPPGRSLIKVDPETFQTARPGVFAGGDCVNGADLVVTALADGRRAAQAIDHYLETLPKSRPSTIVGLRTRS
ncbi:MAG: NAD(P)-dependent oxidoreductase [Chloroflexi bacterium]|nr:NAD(P)-dependent oxidoreductase [Chloroflexota bacterium]